MGIVIRQSLLTTVISYTGAIIGYINLLYLYPRFLSTDQVGILRIVQDAAILFSPFAQFGLAQSIYRFHPRVVNNPESEKAFINIVVLLGLGGFGIFVIGYKLFEGSIVGYFEENAQQVIQYSSVILWFTLVLLLISIFEAYSRSLLKAVFPNLLREVVIRILLSALVLMFFFGWLTFDQFIIGSVGAYLLSLLCLIIYLAWQKRLAIAKSFSFIDKGIIRELTRYSLFSFAGTAGMIVVGKIDSLMVGGLIGPSAVAVYTTAFYMATIIEYPKRAITQVVMPLIARSFENNQLNEISGLYRKTSINQFVIGSILLLGIYINLDNIFASMPKQDEYSAGKWVVILVGVGKLIDMAFGPSSEIIVLSRYYWFNMVLILILAAIVIVANNILIPIYGINGAAVGVALALFLFNFIKFLFIGIKFRIQPFDVNTAKLLIVIPFTMLINELIPTLPSVLGDMFVRSAAITLFYGTAVLALRISADGNRVFAKGMKRIGLRSPFRAD